MDIPPKQYPPSLTSVMHQEGVVSLTALFNSVYMHTPRAYTATSTQKQGDWTTIKYLKDGNVIATEKRQGLQRGDSWTGNQAQLRRAIEKEQKQVLVQTDASNHLQLQNEFRQHTDIFINGQEADLKALGAVRLDDVSQVNTHCKAQKMDLGERTGVYFSTTVHRYALWIETKNP
jgi:hypothetical protein